MSPMTTRPGLLLLSGDPKRVASWLGRGTVPAYVVPVGGWTAVVPAGESAAAPPYDDGLTMLANRPVPNGFRSALGFFVLGARAVMTVHPSGWHAVPRWLFWESGKGSLKVPDLRTGQASDLVDAAGVVTSQGESVRALLRSTEGDPLSLLRDVIETLALPAGRMLGGSGVPTAEDAVLVTPSERDVARFERTVGEERIVRNELEEMQ